MANWFSICLQVIFLWNKWVICPVCAIWLQVVVINNYIVNLFSLQYFATSNTSMKQVANLFNMHDMAGGGKKMLELFIMNVLATGVIYMQYCGLFQYAQSSRFQVVFNIK